MSGGLANNPVYLGVAFLAAVVTIAAYFSPENERVKTDRSPAVVQDPTGSREEYQPPSTETQNPMPDRNSITTREEPEEDKQSIQNVASEALESESSARPTRIVADVEQIALTVPARRSVR